MMKQKKPADDNINEDTTSTDQPDSIIADELEMNIEHSYKIM